MSTEHLLFTLWASFLLVCSAIAWLGSRSMSARGEPPPKLNLSFLDYVIFLWVFLMLFVGTQSVMQLFLAGNGSDEAASMFPSDEWGLVLSSLSLQIPLLGVMLAAFTFRGLPFHHADANSSGFKIVRELFYGLRLFIMCLPVIWVISSIWKLSLDAIYGIFTDEELQVQEIVSTVSESTALTPIIALTLLGIIMAPIAEELFFRGSIYRFLKDVIGTPKGMVISASIFACMHWNMRALLPLFVVGLCLAWVYEHRGNIWAPISFHMAFNAQSFVLIFILRGEG